MAYTYVWPPTLPQTPQKGFAESGGVLILRSPTDAGPAKQRRRGNKPSTMQPTFIMTTAQVATFEDFVLNTLKGTARFGYKHPRKGTVVEVRIVPQSDSMLYNITYLAPGFWTVTMQFEILP